MNYKTTTLGASFHHKIVVMSNLIISSTYFEGEGTKNIHSAFMNHHVVSANVELFHVVNVSLNMSFNDNHQILTYQLYDPSTYVFTFLFG